jgi:antitoxin VapB
MRKEGDRLIIEPAPPQSLLAVLATLAPLHEDFPPIGVLLRTATGRGIPNR